MIPQPLPALVIAGQIYEIVAVGPDLGTLTLRRAGEDEPVAVVRCRDAGVEFAVIHRGQRMDGPPPRAETRAAKGITCPCGGPVEVRRVYRQRPGVVVRYRYCLLCRARLKTRETVTSVRPPK